jgi:L-lactate dehydrogenase complex protein LldF
VSARAELRDRVEAAVADRPMIEAVHLATLRKVEQRRAGMSVLRDVEALRALAAQVKQHTLEQLPHYLEEFVLRAEARGARVHLARDAAAARRLIVRIARDNGATLAVKAKSMATEEVHLNAALSAAGLPVVETDLGEFIVQLDRDRPSHIVTPIIHKDRRQVAAALARELGCAYTEDPAELTRIARAHLRDVFRRCDLGITGANFAIAETGTLVVCTNEGNARMTTTRPAVQVTLVGIEKLIPRLIDLPVFLKLLARSSTGQPMTIYTNLITGPRGPDDPDGPDELHIVLLDAGRSDLLGGALEEVLRCIRCGACLNACPAYRNLGGHAYRSVYPGPIGALVTPLLSPGRGRELARLSSLCGACEAACPVKIDIPKLLVELRARTLDTQGVSKRLGMMAWRWVMGSPRLYAAAQQVLRMLNSARIGPWLGARFGALRAWTECRDLPPVPRQSFRQWWRETGQPPSRG